MWASQPALCFPQLFHKQETPRFSAPWHPRPPPAQADPPAPRDQVFRTLSSQRQPLPLQGWTREEAAGWGGCQAPLCGAVR